MRLPKRRWLTSWFSGLVAPAGSDYTKLWSELRDSIALLKTREPGPGHAGFHHLVGDYSVGYYG